MVDAVYERAVQLDDGIYILRCPDHHVKNGRRDGINKISKPGSFLLRILHEGEAKQYGVWFNGASALRYLMIKGKWQKPRRRSFANY